MAATIKEPGLKRAKKAKGVVGRKARAAGGRAVGGRKKLGSAGKVRKELERTLLESERVAKAVAAGKDDREIGREIGVPAEAVKEARQSPRLAELMQAEAERLLHLGTRDLSGEKYRDLAQSLGVIVDRYQLLSDRPTSIVSGDRLVERVSLILFGPGAVQVGGGDRTTPGINVARDVLGTLRQLASRGTGGDATIDIGSQVREMQGEPGTLQPVGADQGRTRRRVVKRKSVPNKKSKAVPVGVPGSGDSAANASGGEE
jgi:hypothetical protein